MSSTLYPLFLTVVRFIVLLMLGSMQGASKVTTLHFLSLDLSRQLCMFTNPFNTFSSETDPNLKKCSYGDYKVVIVLCEIQSGACHIIFYRFATLH